MKKDIVIKVIFIIILAISIYLIVSGIFSTGSSSSSNNEIDEESLTLSDTNISLVEGDTYTVTATVLPENATNKKVVWYSTNPNIADVNDGVIKGIKEGTTMIIATTERKQLKKVVNVNVTSNKIPVEKIEIENKQIEMYVADQVAIQYTIIPENATNKKVSMKSSDSTIVSFTKDGEIVALKKGEVTVTITCDGIEENVNITVKEKIIEPTSIKVDKNSVSLKINEEQQVTATISPSNATDKSIKWETSDDKVATVSDGKIKGVSAGTATITASTINDKKATIEVKVIEDVKPPITENPDYKKGFTEVISYNSNTLKYRIQKKDSADYVLIWVADAYKQMNSAIPSFGNAKSAEYILSHEVSTYKYQNKGLVAVNGSFFLAGWGGSPGIPYVINKGKVLRDVENKKYSSNMYGSVGITKDGILKLYGGFSSTDYNANLKEKERLNNDGIRNNFAFAVSPIDNDGSLLKADSGRDGTNRTVICQIDKNNFILYSGSGLSLYGIGKELKTTFGCAVAANLDGGGSRKLYYKTNTMAEAKRRFGGDRAIADMLYFVEQ